MPVSLWSCLDEAAQRAPGHPAVIFEHRVTSYAGLREQAVRVSDALWTLGVRPGDRVALLAANRPEYLVLLFAAARIGASLVPLNTRYGSADLQEALRRCGASVLFYARGFRRQDFGSLLDFALRHARADGALQAPELPELRRAICLDDDGPQGDVLDRIAPGADRQSAPELPEAERAEAVGLMLFTSGSSGFPKPVMLGQGQMVRNMARVRDRQGIRADDRMLSYLPYFHVFGGLISLLVPILSDATIVMMPAFESAESMALVQRYRCTVVYGVATTYGAWFNDPEYGNYDLSSLRTGICSAGLPAMSATARRVRAEIAPMHSLFGMTETMGVASLTLADDDEGHATGSAGRPLPDAGIAIVDPATGARLPAGEPGEIRVRGDMVTKGYFRMPEQTARAIDAEGWLHTGDRGWLDEHGYLCVAGRLDDRLRCGGENIDPREVEHFIQTHPGVAACQVVGVPDPRLIEIPVAFIVARAGSSVGEVEIQEYCRGRIANFKTPRRVFAVEEFPGWMHKVQRYKLREDAMRRMGLEEPKG